MKKVYLEKRHADYTSTSPTFDLHDINMFIQSELASYDLYESSSPGLQEDVMSPVVTPGLAPKYQDQNIKSEARPEQDEDTLRYFLPPTTGHSESSSHLPRVSSHFSTWNTSGTSSGVSHNSHYLGNGTSGYSIEETITSSDKKPTGTFILSKNRDNLNHWFPDSIEERKVFSCQHPGCSKKYTKLSHLKVNPAFCFWAVQVLRERSKDQNQGE